MHDVLTVIIWVGATFRITHLLVFDTITERLRNYFFTVVTPPPGPEGQILPPVAEPRGRGLRRLLGQLLSCHWCCGFWITCAVVISATYWPPVQFLWTIFAVAGLAGWIENRLYG